MKNIRFTRNYTEKTVSLNQGNISFIYGQRKNFFDLNKVWLIQKNFLSTKDIKETVFWVHVSQNL